MASVRRLRSKSGAVVYQARWRVRAGSRWLDRAKNFDRAADARAYAARMGLEMGQVGDPDRLSCASYFERYLAALETEGERSEVTIAVYRKALNWAARELGHVPLAKLNVGHIDDCYVALLQGGLKRSTVSLIHRTLSAALRRARKRRLILSNPCEDASPPAPTRSRVKAFTPAQVRELLRAAAIDPELHAIASTLVITGLRRGELLGLLIDDVDLDAGVLAVRRSVVEAGNRVVERERGKSRASMRTMSIPAALVEILRMQRTRVMERALRWGAGWERPLRLFPGVGGKPMPPGMLTRRLRALMQSAGIVGPSPVHAWRHTAGTMLYDATGNVKTVQQRLGHTRASTTMDLYVHSSVERDQEAAVHLGRLLEPK